MAQKIYLAYNRELDIINYIQTQGLKRVGHFIRKGEERSQRRYFGKGQWILAEEANPRL